VFFVVLLSSDALKVGEIVVKGIVVFVMDIVPFWYLSVRVDPDFPMEVSRSFLVLIVALEVNPVVPPLRVWVSAVGSTVVFDEFNHVYTVWDSSRLARPT